MILLDGKALSNKLYDTLKENPEMANTKLIILTFGEDLASKVYVRNKLKACEYVGIKYEHIILDENMSVEEFDRYIFKLINENVINYSAPNNHLGIILQLPAPQKFVELFNENINPYFDVDGFLTRNRELLPFY